MFVPTVNRATIAGLGTTGALLAAVVAVSLMVGGLVAYSGSPGGPLVSREPRLALPGTVADTTQRVAGAGARPALTVPAAPPVPAGAVTVAPPAAPTGGRVPRSRGGSAGVPSPVSPATPGKAGSEPVPTTGSPTGAAPARPPIPGLPAVPAVPIPASGLANTTSTAGQALGGTLRQGLGAVGTILDVVSPPLGQTVDGLGIGVGGTVTQTADTVAAVLRRLGGRRHP